MADKELRKKSDKQAIDQFIHQVQKLPKGGGGQGRLIFALDATASREATWDQACHLQSELFMATRDLGGLAIQLCYYRGFREFKSTGFVTQTGQLLNLMNGVSCLGGHTQIFRVLAHWFKKLINTSKDTEWGRKYDYKSIKTPSEFAKRVPVSTYEDLKPFIDTKIYPVFFVIRGINNMRREGNP